ncbi:hypothetical protein COOONC_05251 [Cooperia oncophora]
MFSFAGCHQYSLHDINNINFSLVQIFKVDHVRLANQLRASACGGDFSNNMVDVVLYTDEQPEKQSAARFCSKRRISTGSCGESPAKIVRHLRDQLECTKYFQEDSDLGR